MSTDLAHSNSLTDLAERIKVDHTAVATSFRNGVRQAIAAADLLIEAKAQVPHGQWLRWLNEHCAMSERTAELEILAAGGGR